MNEENHAECVKRIHEAFKPFATALTTMQNDTLGRLTPDDHVIFITSGSWSKSSSVTLGDLKRLHRAIEKTRASQGTTQVNENGDQHA